MIGRRMAKLKRFDRSLRPDSGTGKRCRGGPRRAVLRP